MCSSTYLFYFHRTKCSRNLKWSNQDFSLWWQGSWGVEWFSWKTAQSSPCIWKCNSKRNRSPKILYSNPDGSSKWRVFFGAQNITYWKSSGSWARTKMESSLLKKVTLTHNILRLLQHKCKFLTMFSNFYFQYWISF